MARDQVPLAERGYEIVIEAGVLSRPEAFAPLVEERRCLVVTDSNVGPLYADTVAEALDEAGATHVATVQFSAGEPSKTLQTVANLYEAAVQAELDRKSVVLALGGGVVGDLAGFTAATYMRGIDYVQLGTSLVAQVDSAVGGKTGVDLPEGKNLVGAFHQPRLVLTDPTTLKSLDERQLRCGLAEVVKYGVGLDAGLFGYLEAHVDELLAVEPEVYAHVVARCCELKAQVVLADERDTGGQRAVLNYGHTFGHALETLAGYHGMTHGEAIAIGMCMAADLAAARDDSGALQELVRRQDALLDALGLPSHYKGFPAANVLRSMRRDKKFEGGRHNLILPRALGHCELVPGVDECEIEPAIAGRREHGRH